MLTGIFQANIAPKTRRESWNNTTIRSVDIREIIEDKS